MRSITVIVVVLFLKLFEKFFLQILFLVKEILDSCGASVVGDPETLTSLNSRYCAEAEYG